MPEQPLDRRPIATRELGISRRAASWLVRKGVSANAISVAGMICGIAAGAALFSTARCPAWERVLWVVAAALVQFRLLANMLDGMVAVETGSASRVGELYNEIPDRVSDTAVLVGLGYAAGGHVELGYAAALAAIFTAYIRAAGKAGGAPYEFCGPMAKPQRMFLVTLAALYSAAVPAAWKGSEWEVPAIVLVFVIAGSAITAVRRLGRIASVLKGRS